MILRLRPLSRDHWLLRSWPRRLAHHVLSGHYASDRSIPSALTLHAVVSLLLDAGADVNAGNVRRVRPLHNACRIGHFGAARDLIEAGAYLNARDSNRETPLFRVVNKPQETRLVRSLPLTRCAHRWTGASS